ncbi:GGDEF domain-containing protein [Vibrio sonorensis]|uniref:GGDEF domain-containing protein n=1 Tax=Vibrio sonorensis TaxID=1004316 RepID=UPI0008DA948C|nr:GGDEF domain-containing protein [Vibrio sonorensis]
MSFYLDDGHTHLQMHVVKATSLLLALVAGGFTLVNFFVWDELLFGFIDLAYCLVCIYIYSKIQENDYKKWYASLLIFGLSFIILFSLAVAQTFTVIIFWSFCFPPIYHILFNRYLGALFSAIYLIISILLIVDYQNPIRGMQHSVFNYILPYTVIWAISFVYEDIRTTILKKFRQAALSDSLTGAKNRLALESDFNSGRYLGQPHYLLHIDLDHFKAINDTYGHAIGDKVLREVVSLMQQVVGNQQVYRIGGEEFCLVYSAYTVTEAYHVAEEIRKTIADNQIDVADDTIKVTMSGGLHRLAQNVLNSQIDPTLSQTDTALYQAKDEGRNRILIV